MGNVALVQISYTKIILPVEDALTLVRIMGQAQSVEPQYVDSKYEYWTKDTQVEVSLQLIDFSTVKLPTPEMRENKELADAKPSLEYNRKQVEKKNACLKAAQARIIQLEQQLTPKED